MGGLSLERRREPSGAPLSQLPREISMIRKKLSLDDLCIESFATGAESGAVQFMTTTLTDPGDTAPPKCNSIQTCVC
jgi:hypothetical protein